MSGTDNLDVLSRTPPILNFLLLHSVTFLYKFLRSIISCGKFSRIELISTKVFLNEVIWRMEHARLIGLVFLGFISKCLREWNIRRASFFSKRHLWLTNNSKVI